MTPVVAAICALGDQLSAVITGGLAGVGQKIDRLEQSVIDRLDGIDDKLADIREHVLRVEDRQAEPDSEKSASV